MREKQLVQLLQFVFIRVFIGCFVIFVEEKSFVEFLLVYRWYFLIASVSYFYYYSIQYELDKKYESIRYLVLYGNLYLFLHVFFRPLLNISHELFIVLGLIIWGIYGTTKMKSRWKYLLQVFGGILSFFILISGMIYLYPEKPDIDGFAGMKNYQISIFSVMESVPKKDAYLQISESEVTNDIEIVPNFTKVLLKDCKISYPSRKKDRLEKVVIITPKGGVIRIFPQTEVSLKFFDKGLNVSNVSGKVGFLSGFLGSDVEIDGDVEILSEEQQIWIQGVQDGYEYELVEHLKNQILEDNPYWINNTIMHDVEGGVIRILVRLFPATFSKNLHNFEEYQKYFEKFDDKLKIDVSFLKKMNFKYEGGSFWKSLKTNIMMGKTDIYDVFKVYKGGE